MLDMYEPENSTITPETPTEEQPVKEKVMTDSEKLYRAWFKKFFMKDFGKLEKRILDWWTGEGFFGISNLKQKSDGETLDFLVRVGINAYDETSDKDVEYLNEKADKIANVKRRQGWDIYTSQEYPHLHVLYKSQKNIDKLQQLLMSNIRSFKVEKFEYAEMEGIEYIKSFTVRIYRKKTQ